jgi:hypothetical protein
MYILNLLVLFINCRYAEKRLCKFLFYGEYASVYDPNSSFEVLFQLSNIVEQTIERWQHFHLIHCQWPTSRITSYWLPIISKLVYPYVSKFISHLNIERMKNSTGKLVNVFHLRNRWVTAVHENRVHWMRARQSGFGFGINKCCKFAYSDWINCIY